MIVTKENISQIDYFAGATISTDSCKKLLSSLLNEIEELNVKIGKTLGKLCVDYINVHTIYSPERTEPCPDWYGMFRLYYESNLCESIGDKMTIHELDTVLCTLSDMFENATKTIEINLNNNVLAEVNETGWKHVQEYFSKFYDVFPDKDERVKIAVKRVAQNTETAIINGETCEMTRFQLYEFMNIFGRYAYLSGKPFINNNNLYFEK